MLIVSASFTLKAFGTKIALQLEDKTATSSLTWPPEPARWSQRPAVPKQMSPCESRCIFASGLWSPWRRAKREKNTDKGNVVNMTRIDIAWYKLTLRAVRRTVGRTKAKPAAGMSGRKRRGERRRSEVQPQAYGSLPKVHSWDSDWICAVRSDGGSSGKMKCFYSSLCRRTNEASLCHNGHGRNDKKPEGEMDCEGQGRISVFTLLSWQTETLVIITGRQKLTCQRNKQRRGVFKGHVSLPVYKGSKNFQVWTGTLCIICSKRPRKWRLITVQPSIMTFPPYFYVIK